MAGNNINVNNANDNIVFLPPEQVAASHIEKHDAALLAILAEDSIGLSAKPGENANKINKMRIGYNDCRKELQNLVTIHDQNQLVDPSTHFNQEQAQDYLQQLADHYAQLQLLGFVQAADKAFATIVEARVVNDFSLDEAGYKKSKQQLRQIYKQYESAINDHVENSKILRKWASTSQGQTALDYYHEALRVNGLCAKHGIRFEKANRDLRGLLSLGKVKNGRGNCVPRNGSAESQKEIKRMVNRVAETAFALETAESKGAENNKAAQQLKLAYPHVTSKVSEWMQRINYLNLTRWHTVGKPPFDDNFASNIQSLTKNKAPRKHWIWLVLQQVITSCLNGNKDLIRKLGNQPFKDSDLAPENNDDNSNLQLVPSNNGGQQALADPLANNPVLKEEPGNDAESDEKVNSQSSVIIIDDNGMPLEKANLNPLSIPEMPDNSNLRLVHGSNLSLSEIDQNLSVMNHVMSNIFPKVVANIDGKINQLEQSTKETQQSMEVFRQKQDQQRQDRDGQIRELEAMMALLQQQSHSSQPAPDNPIHKEDPKGAISAQPNENFQPLKENNNGMPKKEEKLEEAEKSNKQHSRSFTKSHSYPEFCLAKKVPQKNKILPTTQSMEFSNPTTPSNNDNATRPRSNTR